MSLIVARKRDGQICVVSDTKLTYQYHEVKRQQTNPAEGIIKTIVLRPNVSISFAGIRDPANSVLKTISSTDAIVDIIEKLKISHLESKQTTEYILCYDEGEPVIYKFKNGEVGEVMSCWIGDNGAFSLFQEAMDGKVKKEKKTHKYKTPKDNNVRLTILEMDLNIGISIHDYFSKMTSAMDKVIESGNINSVGGFKIAVICDKVFRYHTYLKMYRGIIPIRINSGGFSIGHGPASEGAYTMHFIGSSPDYNSIGIHIKQANLGILYSRLDGKFPEPIQKNLDEVDFLDWAKKEYNLVALVNTQDKETKYLVQGREFAAKKEYRTAIENLDIALETAKNRIRAHLLFHKGGCLVNLGDMPAASKCFDECVAIDSTFREIIMQSIRTNKPQ